MMIERIARAIAEANGDNFSNAFKNKSRWIAKRGESGGRFRDVNEPFQSDYLDMARAALTAMLKATPGMLNAAVDATGAGSDMSWSNMSPQTLFERGHKAMIQAAIQESTP